ncbi:TRAP dicarboxylate transporter subunit DctP [Actinobacillus equuli]|nr:TRAP dicarboxylate transporter subunit DctP [Actinobacillus equuli]
MANAEISLRFGYEAPRSDSQHVAAKKFDELLKDKTKGEIKLKLFPDSTLGNAQTMISGVRGGTIDIEMSGSPNFTGLEPKLNVIDIPFIFKDREHVYKVLDGEIGQGLLQDLEKQGLKGLAFWDVGFRAFSNSKHAVNKPEDIKGLKVRTNQNPMYIKPSAYWAVTRCRCRFPNFIPHLKPVRWMHKNIQSVFSGRQNCMKCKNI